MKLIHQSSIIIFLYYVGWLLTKTNTLWLLPNVFTTTQIGIYKSIHNLGLLLGMCNLGNAVMRYFVAFSHSKAQKAAFFGFVLLTTCLNSIAIALACYVLYNPIAQFFAKRSPDVAGYLPFSVLIALAVIWSITLKDWCKSLLHITVPNIFYNVALPAMTGLTLLAYHHTAISFDQLLKALVGVYLIYLLLYVAYLWYKDEWQVSFDSRYFGSQFTSKYVQYGLYAFLGSGGATFIMEKIENLIVLSQCGSSHFGIYSIMVALATVVNVPWKAIRQVSIPLLARMWNKHDQKGIQALYQSVTDQQFLVSLLLFLLFRAHIDNILSWLGPSYASGKQAALLIALGRMVDTSLNVSGDVLIMSKNFRFSSLAMFIALCTGIPLYFAFINLWDLVGAATAGICTLFFYRLMTCGYVWFTMGMQPISSAQITTLLAGFVTCMLHSSLSISNMGWTGALLRSLLIISTYTFIRFSSYRLFIKT